LFAQDPSEYELPPNIKIFWILSSTNKEHADLGEGLKPNYPIQDHSFLLIL